MQCPKCRFEVADWHFYCPNCHALVHDSNPGSESIKSGIVERAGFRLLNVAVILVMLGVLILMGRAIRWGELFRALRGDAPAMAETGKGRIDRSSSAVRPSAGTATRNSSTSHGSSGKKETPESVRALPNKIEELAAPEDLPKPARPLPTATPAKTESPSSVISAPEPKPTPKPAQPKHPKEETELGVERIEAKQYLEVGYVAINSYMPARIYVDGQFSGLTPRTIKLSTGEHLIRLIADGYEDWTRKVRLKSTQQIGMMASMKKKAATQD